ncbi:MAG: hypothetical protein AAGK97_06550 [Bacteroidota bacterium]
MELHLTIVGILLMLISALHFFFPWYFKWKEDLASLDPVNKSMHYSHTFFLVLILIFNAILALFYQDELIQTSFGKTIAGGIAIFWGIRLIYQWFGFPMKLWKGKAFETSIHILFTFIWSYLAFVFYQVAT